MKRNIRSCLFLCAFYALFFVSPSPGWNLPKDFPFQIDKNTNPGAVSEANMVYCFFRDNFLFGDYTYIYPKDESEIHIDEKVFKNGVASLRFDFHPDTFSGGAICLYKRTLDLRSYLKKGAVQFWIKCAPGAEMVWVSLVDDNSDFKKTIVRLLAPLKQPSQDWSLLIIPLKDFNSVSVSPCYWDTTAKRELPSEFNWERVAEFRIESKKNENTSFRVWVDDVFIVKKLK